MGYQSIFRPGLFAGQTILVTGGGSGIGRCIAHELASLGAQVAICGRRAEKLERVAEEIRGDGGLVEAHVCDIREEAAVKATIAAIVSRHGRLDGVVNNAGGQFPARLEAISQKGWDAVVRNNLTGTFVVSREAVTQSMREHGGAIVCMLADFTRGMPGMGHSGAARAGVDNFCMTAAVEWARFNVRVNAIAPGIIASSGLDAYDAAKRKEFPTVHRQVPLQRLGSESEVSAAVVFLLSPAAGYITGATLKVDGALSLFGQLLAVPEHGRSHPFNGFHRAQAPEALRGGPESAQP